MENGFTQCSPITPSRVAETVTRYLARSGVEAPVMHLGNDLPRFRGRYIYSLLAPHELVMGEHLVFSPAASYRWERGNINPCSEVN